MSYQKLEVKFDTYNRSLSLIVLDLVYTSNSIYKYVLSKKTKLNTYLICVGQSPAYYALSMMNQSIYDEKLVKIIILPYSSSMNPTLDQADIYNNYLKQNNIQFTNEDEIFFMDQIQHGDTITNFLSIFLRNKTLSNYFLITLNFAYPLTNLDYCGTRVIKQFSSESLPRLSDSFPRIVQHYRPDMFKNKPMKVGFIDLDTNPYVSMIIECSQIYPKVNSEWYKLNNVIS